MSQEPKETTAGEAAEHVDDSRHYRERCAHAEAEKRHGDQAEILERKNDDRGDENNDYRKIDPAHDDLVP